MAKVKYDVSDVEPGIDFDTPIPRGAYRCKVADCTEGTSKSSGNPMLTVEYEITQRGDWKGRKLWDYIVLNDASAWKLEQLVSALGKRAKGTLDTVAIVGERVLVKVKHETDDRDPENPVVRARVGSVNKLPSAAEEPEDDEEEEDDEDEGTTDDITYEDLEEMDRDDLEQLVEDEELEIRITKRTSDEKLLERVAEALDLEEPEDEGDEEDDEDEDEAPDYGEMGLKGLKAAAKERGLSTRGPKNALVERLEEDDEEDGGEPF